tara:strand:+ start:38 stop:415 length:378 start_codon:yes stop_codon:yes gene_type:complete
LGLFGSKEINELNKEINKMYASNVTESSISIGTNSQPQTAMVEPPIFLLSQLDTLEMLAVQLAETLRSTEYHTSLFFETASEETKTAKAVLANAPPSERLKILVETIGLCSEIAARNRQAISRIF